MSLADNLTRLLTLRGLSQADLARLSGLSSAAINRYVSGKRIPTLDHANRLAHTLGVSVETLLSSEPVSVIEGYTLRHDLQQAWEQLDRAERLYFLQYQITRLIEEQEKLTR